MQPLRSHWLHSCRLQGPPRAPHSPLPPISAYLHYDLLGKFGMMVIIMKDPQLNTPMYFFLGNLSFFDLFYSSVIAPKAMINFWSESKSISFAGCVSQLFLFVLFIVTEGFLLAVMAYDRFIAICNPLLYTVQMSTRLCVQWVTGSYFCGCISSVLQTIMTFTLSFYASQAIDHFYCDTRPLQRLSYSYLFILRMVSFTFSVLIVFPTIIVIIVSYLYIVSTVLKIPSTEGRQKAFSTCSSHLGVVSVLYGAVFFMYLTPDTFPELSKVASLCYTLLTPMLNPLIYSRRSKDVKEALNKLLEKKSTILWFLFSSTNEWCLFILYSSGHQWDYSPEYHRNVIRGFLRVMYYFHIVLLFHLSIIKHKYLGYWRCSGHCRYIFQDESSH